VLVSEGRSEEFKPHCPLQALRQFNQRAETLGIAARTNNSNLEDAGAALNFVLRCEPARSRGASDQRFLGGSFSTFSGFASLRACSLAWSSSDDGNSACLIRRRMLSPETGSLSWPDRPQFR
jgi:hypothetical protein